MKRREFLAGTAAALVLPLAAPALAQGTGFSADGIKALRAAMAAEVETGKVPGLVYLVARGDDVEFQAAGHFDIEGTVPMARDTIFRIASLSKPIVATAMMILLEEGKFTLDEPVDRLLPELANRRVLTSVNAPLDATVPAERPITIRQLLTFTLGFGIQFDSSLPIQQALVENQMTNDYPFPFTPHDPDEWIRRLGALPWMAQPDSMWMYNTGALIWGVLIRRAAGMPLGDFLKTRIFDPLGMVDTGFVVPKEKQHRLPPLYSANWETNEIYVEDEPDGLWSTPPVFPSAAGGLASTVDDCLAFARMLMNKGVHNGTRILSEASVAEMTRDQLEPSQKGAVDWAPGFFDTSSWGYGMAVSTAPSPIALHAGRYGWDGGFGITWANDPTAGLIGILMTQSTAYYAASEQFRTFWSNANAAVA